MIGYFIIFIFLSIAIMLWTICQVSSKCNAALNTEEQELYLKKWKATHQPTIVE